MSNLIKEGLSKLLNSFSRHSGTGLRHTSTGSGQNQVSNNYLLDAGIHQHDDIDT